MPDRYVCSAFCQQQWKASRNNVTRVRGKWRYADMSTYRLISCVVYKLFIYPHRIISVHDQPIVEAENANASFCYQLILITRNNNFNWDYPCDLAKLLIHVDRFAYYRSIKAERSYAGNRTLDVACQVTDSFASAKNITEIFFSLLVYSYATFGAGWINLVSFSSERFFNQTEQYGMRWEKTAACNGIAMNFRFIVSAVLAFTSQRNVNISTLITISSIVLNIVHLEETHRWRISNSLKRHVVKNEMDNFGEIRIT